MRMLYSTLSLRQYAASPSLARATAHLKPVRQSRRYSTRATADCLQSGFGGGPLLDRIANALQSLGYGSIVVVGLGIIGTSIYYVREEMVEQKAAYGMYEKTLELVKQHSQLQKALGAPIEGHLDSGLGRRRGNTLGYSVSKENGGNVMFMRFYLSGPRSNAKVHVELQKDDDSDWNHRLVMADLPALHSTQQIIVLDNRPIVKPSMPEKRWFNLGYRK
ncbi:TIM21-domain-containing protein [Gaertneriomyces semiglobifer]|nr:TIM21-domain-containing protein [Gaertneriomyces semiglobifer]